MSILGIEFNGYHSWKDKNLTMAPGKNIGRPSKRKRKRRLPFSNKEYDFSLGYGSQEYENRSLKYSFNLISKTKKGMNYEVMAIQNWLMGTVGKKPLWDDAFPGYHFLAEVEDEASFDENWTDGILTVTFDAYPFLIADKYEGNDDWDSFNFLLDFSQLVDFEIKETKTVTLYNPGINQTIPEFIANSTFSIKKDDVLITVFEGTTENEDFVLDPGENRLIINGNGYLSIRFYKELI